MLFACHKVDQVCTHAKVEHKIPCRSFPHDHDHEHRLYVPGCTQIAKFKIFENPPYVQSPFKQKFFFEILIFPLAPIGVFPPGSAHARPSAQPLSTPAEICLRMCLGWGGIESFLAILGDSKHFSFLNGPGGGGGQGGPTIPFTPNLIFCDLKPHAKFQNPAERREKNTVNTGHIVP